MRAAIYTRISRDDEGEGLGVRRQEDDCRALSKQRGWSDIEVFVDNDASAYSGRPRPRYKDMIAAVEQGRVGAIVAWAPERLHRSLRELEDFIDLVERTGCVVETVKAGRWDVATSHGRLVARMLGAVARSESERTGERVRRAHQQAKAEGKWRGPIPFGMRASSAPGLPEVDPYEAQVVMDILTRARRGDALTAIAADLNRAGLRPRRGTKWTHTGISRLLASPALGGLVEVDGVHRKAAFTGLVDPDTWRVVQDSLRQRPRGEKSRPRQVLTLLGGIIQCAEHQQHCFASGTSAAPVYRAGVPGVCHVSVGRNAADAFVTDLVLERLRRPDAAELLQPAAGRDDHKGEVEELRRRRQGLVTLIADGVISSHEARTKLDALAAMIQSLEVSRIPKPSTISDGNLINPAQAWEEWNTVQRREVIRLLFNSIDIQHVGFSGGPRLDPSRFVLEWAA